MHHIEISSSDHKRGQLEVLLPQIQALVKDENDTIANLSNITAALKQGCDYFWVGFYMVKEEELVLGPFQGPVACTRIGKGKGVCGAAWERMETILVPDVEQFPGHIACNSASKSEVVLPVIQNGKVTMVLDVDSDKLNDFDQDDQWFLEQVVSIVANL
jgi:GAF domain-containing protein